MVYSVKIVFDIFGKIPTRFNVGVMLFIASFVSYMLRVNFSIIIIAMSRTEPTDASKKLIANLTGANETITISNQDDDDRFNWTNKDHGLLLSAYFWGYVFPNLLGGILSERVGGRMVVFYTMFLSSVVTALSPLAASDNLLFMFCVRVVLGIFGGFLYPACHHIIAKWAPPDEKGKFVSSLLGGTLGTVFTFPIMGFLNENFGWRYGFYVPAALSFIMSIIWLYVVSDEPANHPRISKTEKDMIEKSLGNALSGSKKPWPPIAQMFTSLPFYSLLLLHYGSTWGLFFLLTAAPKFMTEALSFNLAKAGVLSSLPYFARLLAGFFFGAIGDRIRSKDILSVTAIRKSFCVFSHIIPGLLLLLIAFMGTDPYICVLIIILSLGFNGAATVTNLQNSQDLAPNYAGSLYGIINFFGTTSGFISPLVVAYFTHEHSTLNEWQYVFGIGALAYIIPAAIFIAFGSGNVQKWNDTKDCKDAQQSN